MRSISRTAWLFPALIFTFFVFFSEFSSAQYGPVDPLGITTTLTLANAVQKAVEGGNHAFLAVLVLMIGMQFMKSVGSSRFPSLKQHTASYSAIGGAGIGSVMAGQMGGDPVAGAVGGMMVGNAASGLYSTSKSVGSFISKGPLAFIPYIFTIGIPLALVVAEIFKKTPLEKRKEKMADFDTAFNETKDKENPSTKGLEKWFSKNL